MPSPSDYVIATGESHPLESFVAEAFAALHLDWREHVEHSAELLRPIDLGSNSADPGKAERELGWKARYKMADVIRGMLDGLELPNLR